MSALARFVSLLLGAVVIACAWLPWAGGNRGLDIPIKTLWDPSVGGSLSNWYQSMGLLMLIAGGLLVLGAITGSRVLVIVGGLLAAGGGIAWILANAISSDTVAVKITNVQVGAYAAIAAGIMALIIAAVATDTKVPTAR